MIIFASFTHDVYFEYSIDVFQVLGFSAVRLLFYILCMFIRVHVYVYMNIYV